jgi:hypothetical protein
VIFGFLIFGFVIFAARSGSVDRFLASFGLLTRLGPVTIPAAAAAVLRYGPRFLSFKHMKTRKLLIIVCGPLYWYVPYESIRIQ